MKKLLLPLAMMALIALPATAQAEQCRNAKGQFAKCGTPGAVHGRPKAAPAMKPAMAPAMAPAKKAPCKDGKGKFIKCPA